GCLYSEHGYSMSGSDRSGLHGTECRRRNDLQLDLYRSRLQHHIGSGYEFDCSELLSLSDDRNLECDGTNRGQCEYSKNDGCDSEWYSITTEYNSSRYSDAMSNINRQHILSNECSR